MNGDPGARAKGGKEKKRPSCVYCLCVCVCRDGPADVLRLLSAVDRNIYQLPTPVQRSSVLAPWHYNTPVDSALSSAHDVRSIFSLPSPGKTRNTKINFGVCAWLGRDIAQVDIYQTTQLLYFYIFIIKKKVMENNLFLVLINVDWIHSTRTEIFLWPLIPVISRK